MKAANDRLRQVFQPASDGSRNQDMERMTQELIDASLHSGGRYYLPYHLQASVERFQAAYPQAEDFFCLKRKYDPDNVFENEFYLKYARP